MGIIWGLVAALCWGASDFTARSASMRLGALRSLLYAQLVGFAGLFAVMHWHGALLPVTVGALLLGALLGAAYTAGTVLLYDAMASGPLMIVSPIGSSFAAITLGLSLLSGDDISPLKVGGLALALGGIILASIPAAAPSGSGLATPRPARSVIEAAGAACLFGVTFWGLKYVVPGLGLWLPVFESRMMALVLLPVLARPLRQSIALPPLATWPLLLVVGIIDTCGTVAYNRGLGSDAPGVVAVLGSLFSPVTLLLAFVLLGERLARRQWAGVLVIFAAIALVGVAQNGFA